MRLVCMIAQKFITFYFSNRCIQAVTCHMQELDRVNYLCCHTIVYFQTILHLHILLPSSYTQIFQKEKGGGAPNFRPFLIPSICALTVFPLLLLSSLLPSVLPKHYIPRLHHTINH